MTAAMTGGEPRFHHSGPYTHPSSAKRRQKAPSNRTGALGERFEHEGGGEMAVPSDAGVCRAHQLEKGALPLAHLEHAVEEEEGCPVGQTRHAVAGCAHRYPSLTLIDILRSR